MRLRFTATRLIMVCVWAAATTSPSQDAAARGSQEPAPVATPSSADDPVRVENGLAVPECAWPSVVALYDDGVDEQMGRGSGVYIGGNVVITAAHVVSRGFIVTGIDCDVDEDCPSTAPYDNIDLECDSEFALCRDPDDSLSNGIPYALFGEQYPMKSQDGHIRKAVPIAYCQRVNSQPLALVQGTANDFAYCVLTAEPNVQPVPVMMHCEADQFLLEDTRAVAVGFGNTAAGMSTTGGVKRFATTALPQAFDATAVQLAMSLAVWSPGQPLAGDSGGPLLVQLDDNTWRVIGVASTVGVETYVTPWPHIAWMAGDSNVDADALTPCHTETGTWDPGPDCSGFPLTPDSASGRWARNPIACRSTNLSGAGATCAGMLLSDEPAPASAQMPRAPAKPPPSAAGCAAGGRPGGAPVCLALLAFALCGVRRRGQKDRRCWPAMAALAAIVSACGGSPGSVDDTATGGGTGCKDLIPGPSVPGNPDFKGVISGEGFAESYARVAAGDVRDNQFFDYVLASDASNTVRIVAAASTNGLSVFRKLGHDTLSLGGANIEDIALADADGDGFDDLFTLRADSTVTLHYRISGGKPYFEATPSETGTAQSGGIDGRQSMAVGDVDCDGVLDIVVAAQDDEAILWLDGSGPTPFSVVSVIPTAGFSPQRVVLFDLEPDTDLDILASGGDGDFASVLSDCSGQFADEEVHVVIPGAFGPTPDMPIAAGEFCDSHPDAGAVLIGRFGKVFAACANDQGSFIDVVEPHGKTEANSVHDYLWDLSDELSHRVRDLALFSPSREGMLLYNAGATSPEILYLVRSKCQISSPWVPLANAHSVGTYEQLLIHGDQKGATTWKRLAFLFQDGLGCVH